ncbi:FAD dependent oxidoreductase (plasmid) [Gemmatirosa kalamazoonensis]|uniref:FAD dependent oxidoreductase n=1 Tax=Gemmatirosa kalamazoonensis TaxID=861299 RepID=W0RP04_9BACT|nr:FAD-dependent oxidoreductase [Gemmatirosa kalamazoonensis]AHG92476.1 FAD dependent oxidoreductase [Gemmatirosa kalamazoonensis]
MTGSEPIVIVGAGLAGVAAAYHLAARRGVPNVVLVDEREPLTLTSAVGTMGYRNWWPGPDDTMCRFVSRSIDLLEEMADESANAFRLSARGYLFATARAEEAARLRATAREVSAYGMGELREHADVAGYEPARAEGYRGAPTGADLLLGEAARAAFPYLAPDTVAALHVRRAGWMNAVALGAWMLRRALGAGATFVRGRVDAVDTAGGRVRGVRLDSGATLGCDRVVLAAGPGLPRALRLLDADVPLLLELHAKMLFRDPLGAVPRGAPFLIWNDPVDELPPGIHVRPVDGPHGDETWLIWTYDIEPRAEPVWPPTFDPRHGEFLLRGAAALIPGFAAYAGRAGVVDGGYYCKTPENRPVIGPLGAEGAFVLGGLSGYGIMASHAAAELAAAHVTGDVLPAYAGALSPARYEDAGYRARVVAGEAGVGQL